MAAVCCASLLQAHVLFTHLSEQLDSLASAAETVAAAISSDHAMQAPAAGQGRLMPAAANSSTTGSRKQRAEARQRAFAAAALARCTARLTGQRHAAAGKAGAGGASGEGPGDVATAGVGDAAGVGEGRHSSSRNMDGSSSRRGRAARDVAEEVSALVAAATSVDKLSRMYEGWAAWL